MKVVKLLTASTRVMLMFGVICACAAWPLRAFGDGPGTLSLPQAVSAALAYSPSARASSSALAQFEARLGQAQAQRKLAITFNSTVSGSNARVIQPPPNQETFGTFQNTLTVPLPIGRKVSLGIAQASAQLSAAQAQFVSARLALAGQVAAAYFDVLRKNALQLLAGETLSQAQRELESARKRNRAGDVAALDVLQAQVPVATAQANLYRAQNEAEVARETLNDLIGRPLDAPLALAEVSALHGPVPYTLVQARTLAQARSLDVRVADAGVRAGGYALAAARLFREPAYSLQVIDTRSTDKTSFSRDDTLQAQVSLPLTDGGLGQAQVREAQAALAQAQAQAEMSRRAVRVAVSIAYVTALSSRTQLEAANSARAIAQTMYDKTVQGYENGLFPLINVLNAQNALAQARIAAIQALYDAASAENALDAALNGDVGQPVKTVPAPLPALPRNTTLPGAATTSPAGAGTPGTTPAGTSTTGPATSGTAAP